MRASSEEYDDGISLPGDESDLAGEDMAAGQSDTGRRDFGHQMKVRRRLEQLREERELAYLLRGEFDL